MEFIKGDGFIAILQFYSVKQLIIKVFMHRKKVFLCLRYLKT